MRSLTHVSSFKYLGGILSASDDDWPAVVRNLIQERNKWAWRMQVLGREGEYERMLGMFYVAVVQEVLLYGLETWVMYPQIRRTLGGFHHRLDQILTRWKRRR